MSSSLAAIWALRERGYITKEAGDELTALRDVIITEKVAAFTKEAINPLMRAGRAIGGAAGDFGKAMSRGSERASWPVALARVVKTVGIGAGIAGGAAGVQAGVHGIRARKSRQAVDASREIVLKNLSGPNVTPELRRAHEIVFNTVAEYAPSVAANPAVAQGIVSGLATPATLVKGMPTGLDQNLIRGLAETQSRIDEAAKARGVMAPFTETHGRFLGGQKLDTLLD